ncbi:DEAD/DEAH box helicase [Pseudobutyrivibrio xylanivorans]|uniref:Superfamily II DNA or RNA helicase, SNF2 family n=1 Tax=Pseudobutyrivibrio xylanivorans TaxID=185007 RepID=A0A5P6VUT6_PSEXY|nr:DEAD/DEAH box helicase [Pseudobutyrivibrio xylanivorans]QFJ54571.1 hypothetical protein FXF36_06750 [Pseudobutyrivibrio xylanivorans]
MSKDWKSWFDPTILKRGKDYYDKGRVMELKKTAGGYQVFVLGSSLYTVRIALDGSDVIAASCNCPHALKGFRCKHQAAALIKYSHQKEELLLEQTTETDAKKLNAAMRERLLGEVNDDYQTLDMDKLESSLFINEREKYEALRAVDKGDVVSFEFKPESTALGSEPYILVKGMVKDADDADMSKPVSFHVFTNHFSTFRCDCRKCNPYSLGVSRINQSGCKHARALFFAAYKELKHQTFIDDTTPDTLRLIKKYQNTRANTVAQNITKSLNNSISLQPRLKEAYGELELSFKIGESKMYVVKDITLLDRMVRTGGTMAFGKNTILKLNRENFTRESQPYLDFIANAITRVNDSLDLIYGDEGYSYRRDYYESAYFYKNSMSLEGKLLDEFYDTFCHSGMDFEGERKGVIYFQDKNLKAEMHIKPKYDSTGTRFTGVRAQVEFPDIYEGATHSYFIEGDKFCRMSAECSKKLAPLMAESAGEPLTMNVGMNYLSDFYHTFIPEISDYVKIVEEGTDEISKFLTEDVEFTFFLDAENGNVTCQVKATYGKQEYNAMDCYELNFADAGQVERERIVIKEQEILNAVAGYLPFADKEKGYFHCDKDEDLIYNFMVSGVAELAKLGEVQVTDAFQHINVFRETKLSVGVSLSKGMLDLQVTSDEISREELLEILASYRAKKKYHRLRDDSFVDLNDEALATLDEMLATLQITEKDFLKDNMHVPVYRSLYLDKLLEENEGVYEDRDEHFKDLVKGFKTVKDAEFKVPANLSKTMRNYQKTGFKWISTLEKYGFGGILCDDMGLGKTLQTISFLLKHYTSPEVVEELPSLVVCPASLVYNWLDEFSKFAPELNAVAVVGTIAEREEIINDAEKYDVLVTSYDLLKRDVALYEEHDFYYEVIDEAQYIKNHTTAAAKSVKVISSRRRLALTGTPIENRLSELWSIFDFLMPGFLYKYEQFRRQFETPIVKYEDKNASERLKKMVSPFLLRRLKENVLKELPEKLEKEQVVVLDKEQRTLYDAQVAHLKQLIEEAHREHNFEKVKLKIFSEMTRLRQICCDPRLFIDNYKGESAKREACMDLVERAIESGHRMLIFSQFTTMLDLLKKDLDKAGIPYFEITGSTKKEDRLDLVNRFNEGENNVFLISLKAGGTGLNLIGADVVIHYDPWWNLAAQNQATDRAHRIGQKKTVTVYKLITKGTIEEKIVELQNSKSDLADEILSGETNVISKMTESDFIELLG